MHGTARYACSSCTTASGTFGNSAERYGHRRDPVAEHGPADSESEIPGAVQNTKVPRILKVYPGKLRKSLKTLTQIRVRTAF